MKPRAFLLSLPLLLATLTPAFSQEPAQPASGGVDVLEFVDGERLEGTVVGEDTDFVTFRAGGVTRAYPRAKVATLTRGVAPEAGTEPPAASTDGKATDKKARKAAAKNKKDAPLGDVARAWLGELIARAESDDPQVQRSVASAMTALGAQAIEPLREAAAAAEGPRKRVLDSVVRTLEAQRDRKRGKAGAGPRTRAAAAKGRGGLARIAGELELSAEQRSAFGEILEDAYRRRGELVRKARDGSLDAPAVDAAFQALRTQVLAGAKGILDQGQFFVFEDMAERMFALPMAGGKRGKGDGPAKKKKKPVE